MQSGPNSYSYNLGLFKTLQSIKQQTYSVTEVEKYLIGDEHNV